MLQGKDYCFYPQKKDIGLQLLLAVLFHNLNLKPLLDFFFFFFGLMETFWSFHCQRLFFIFVSWRQRDLCVSQNKFFFFFFWEDHNLCVQLYCWINSSFTLLVCKNKWHNKDKMGFYLNRKPWWIKCVSINGHLVLPRINVTRKVRFWFCLHFYFRKYIFSYTKNIWN